MRLLRQDWNTDGRGRLQHIMSKGNCWITLRFVVADITLSTNCTMKDTRALQLSHHDPLRAKLHNEDTPRKVLNFRFASHMSALPECSNSESVLKFESENPCKIYRSASNIFTVHTYISSPQNSGPSHPSKQPL